MGKQHSNCLPLPSPIRYRFTFLKVWPVPSVPPAILMEVIDACLGDTYHQYQAPDGSTVLLLNAEEQSYTLLRSTDGVLLLPRYRLQHVASEDRENSLIGADLLLEDDITQIGDGHNGTGNRENGSKAEEV